MSSPSSAVPQYYWDSCVFLSYLENDPDRVSHIESFFNKAVARDIQIVTSTLSVTEVAYTSYEKAARLLQSEEEQRVEGLWHSPVVLVEYHRTIATKARELIRASFETHGPTLKPLDAIHAATASQHNVQAFHTYDKRLTRALGPLVPFAVCEPLAEQLSIALTESDHATHATARAHEGAE